MESRLEIAEKERDSAVATEAAAVARLAQAEARSEELDEARRLLQKELEQTRSVHAASTDEMETEVRRAKSEAAALRR